MLVKESCTSSILKWVRIEDDAIIIFQESIGRTRLRGYRYAKYQSMHCVERMNGPAPSRAVWLQSQCSILLMNRGDLLQTWIKPKLETKKELLQLLSRYKRPCATRNLKFTIV